MKRNLLLSACALLATAAFAAAPNHAQLATPAVSYRTLPAAAKAQQSAVAGQSATVVTTQSFANGVSVDIVKGEDGQLRKVLRGVAPKTKLGALVKSPAKVKAAATSTFFEGFEGFDGVTSDWIPDGWQDVSKAEPANAYNAETGENITWECVNDGYFYSVYEGEAAVRIQFSSPTYDENYNIIEETKAQDEWLITPSVTPAAYDYLTFMLSYSPAFTALDLESFTFTTINANLEVKITEDGGATWTDLWDVSQDLVNYTEDELWDDAMAYTHPYISVAVDLSAYAGKSVQVAFRYVGINGESMIIDNVNIGGVDPDASFSLPSDVFKTGLSASLSYLQDADGNPLIYGLAPYDAELTWTNTSVMATAAEWTYVDATGASTTSTDWDLVTPGYGYSVVEAPSLSTTFADSDPATYSYFTDLQSGGSVVVNAMDDTGAAELTPYNACTYDLKGILEGTVDMSYTQYFGLTSETNTTWSDLFEVTGLTVTGMGTYIPAKSTPYVLSSATLRLYYASMSDATELKATVYAITSEGLLGEEIASATVTKADIVQPSPTSWATATFNFEAETEEGFYETAMIEVDQPIFIAISSDNLADTDEIYFCGSFESTDSDYEAYSYVCYNYNGSDGLVSTSALTFTNGSCMTNFVLEFDATFAWLDADSDTFAAPDEGGSKTFTIDSYYDFTDTYIGELSGASLGDWYTATSAYDTTTGVGTVTVTVAALPEGTTGRADTLILDTIGATATFSITQGDGGVGEVKMNATTATAVGGDIVVKSSTATAVDVYSLTGQKVATASFSGSATIPAANLSAGAYILKFNDGTVVKLAK